MNLLPVRREGPEEFLDRIVENSLHLDE
jgi:hypothetical protein